MSNKDRGFIETGDAMPAEGNPEFIEKEIDKAEMVEGTGKTEPLIDPEKIGKGPINQPKEMPLSEALKEMGKKDGGKSDQPE